MWAASIAEALNFRPYRLKIPSGDRKTPHQLQRGTICMIGISYSQTRSSVPPKNTLMNLLFKS